MKPSQPLYVWRLRKLYGQTHNISLLEYTKNSLNKGVDSVPGLIYQKTIGKVPPSMIRTMEEAKDESQKSLQLVKTTAVGTINTTLPLITQAVAAVKRSAGMAYDQVLYLKQTGVRGLVLNGYEVAKKKADDSVKRTREQTGEMVRQMQQRVLEQARGMQIAAKTEINRQFDVAKNKADDSVKRTRQQIDEMVRQMQQRALEQARGVQVAAKTEINRQFDMARDRVQKSVKHVKCGVICGFNNVVGSTRKWSEKAIADARKAVERTYAQVKDYYYK